MSAPPAITSAQNSKVKLIQRLRGKRARLQERRFVIDSPRDLGRALERGFGLDYLLYCPELADIAGLPAADCYRVSEALLKRVSYRENPAGVVAVLRERRPRNALPLGDILARPETDSLLVLAGLAVPGNIGALTRTADALGMDAILLVDCALDLYNPNIIRSSTGACFRDGIYQLRADEAIAMLRGAGFQIVAADPRGKHALGELSFGARSAIVLGAEDRGLASSWLEAADCRARVPMQGEICDSLNVSVSGALFLYELRRQRQRFTAGAR